MNETQALVFSVDVSAVDAMGKSHHDRAWFWWTEGEEEIGPFESYEAAQADAIAQGHVVVSEGV